MFIKLVQTKVQIKPIFLFDILTATDNCVAVVKKFKLRNISNGNAVVCQSLVPI